MNNIKIVKYKPEYENDKKYAYAICKCTAWGEAVRIPRPQETDFVEFECPRCGTKLGLFCNGRDKI